jgi:hypothetical protein
MITSLVIALISGSQGIAKRVAPTSTRPSETVQIIREILAKTPYNPGDHMLLRHRGQIEKAIAATDWSASTIL